MMLNKLNKKHNHNKTLKSVHTENKWSIFDNETGKNQQIECLYRKSGHRDNCDQCESILAYSDEGYLTCTNPNCSIIYKDIVDQTPEWRYYGNDDTNGVDTTRCGMPINPLLEESSYGCRVSCGGKMPHYMYRLRRYTEYQSVPHKEKTQFNEFQRISIMAQNSGISKIFIDDAMKFHKKISESEFSFRGDNKDGIIAASVYMACRKNGNPRTAKEIAEIFHLDPTSATHGCKNAQFILNNLEKDMDNDDKTVFCIPKPQDFIERYCTRLNFKQELTKLCIFIACKINKKEYMVENTPNSIATGIIYFISQICSLDISKKDIKSISGISEVTINKCYKRIDLIKTELIPGQIIKKYNIVW